MTAPLTPNPRWKGDCKNLDVTDSAKCPNMKETYSDLRGESYRCEVCGESYYLDYEEMR